VKYYTFTALTRILAGFQENELILEINNKEVIKLLLHYPQQRNLLIEVLKLAHKTGVVSSKKDTLNDPQNINFISFTTEAIDTNASSIQFEYFWY